ncbi:MAG: hypothetical protein QM493_02525 [Sulfurovum sp.]
MVSSKCDYNYTFAGAVGFTRVSVKEELRDMNLDYKEYKHYILGVGRFLTMTDEQWSEQKLKNNIMSNDTITDILLKAFGG